MVPRLGSKRVLSQEQFRYLVIPRVNFGEAILRKRPMCLIVHHFCVPPFRTVTFYPIATGTIRCAGVSFSKRVIYCRMPIKNASHGQSEIAMPEQPLIVHFLFHPQSVTARELARHVHAQLNEDAILPGLRIPTIFTEAAAGGGPPAVPPFHHAKKNFVVVLADNYLVVNGDWGRHAGDIWKKCAASPETRFLPVQLTPKAWPLDADRILAIRTCGTAYASDRISLSD
jgi:hypothetical protein